jgi:hypothetical protein
VVPSGTGVRWRRYAPAIIGHAIPGGAAAPSRASGVRSAILELVLAPARLARDLARWTEAMMLHEAVDPKVSRHLLPAGVENEATW